MNLEYLKKEREKFQTEGNILKEVEILKEILALAEYEFGRESDEYIKNLNELGGTLKYIGSYVEAEEKLNEAKELISKKYGENNLAYATSLLNLTEVYRFAEKYNLLEENYKKIVKIYEENNMDKSFAFAGVCNNFGLYYQNINKFSSAYDLHMRSLEILKSLNDEEHLLEYAVTLSNLFNPCLQLGKKKETVDYLNKSLKIFEENVGTRHPLYAASLNNMAIYCFNEKKFKEAVEYFERAAEISKLTMGEDSDNYKNIISNIKFIKTELLEEKNAENSVKEVQADIKKEQKIKGLGLSRAYFNDVVYPAFKEKLSDILAFCAFGLVGEGSECYGYDDELSQDHDFGPSVCIWLKEKDLEKYKNRIEAVLKDLPKEFKGFKAFSESEWGANRRGLLSLESFYFKFLGTDKIPKTISEWQRIPETALATATNGEVFLDNLGEFTKIREALKKYYPEVIRQNKIASRCMNISQHGQYNYVRCLRRNDFVAANQALYLFVDELIHLVFLLNRKYKIFYKWSNRALLDLEIIGRQIYKILNDMVFAQNKIPYVKALCNISIEEIKRQKLSTIESDFLGDFGVDIQKNIADDFLKNYSPWLD